MSPEAKTPESPASTKGAGLSRADKNASKRFRDPIQNELAERRAQRVAIVARRVFPQWLRTVVAAFVWLAVTPLYAMAISPYMSYGSAQSMACGLVVCSALLAHLWPTRTAPWRTLFWEFWITSAVGSVLLLLDWGTSALTVATLAGFGFLLLRVNQNGRVLVGLVRDWRHLR